MNVLSVEQISKRYKKVDALSALSLQVNIGQVFGLLGPNGSGKSTCLGILLGLIRSDGGRYSWFGEGHSSHVRKRIGALLERPNFSPWLSGFANLEVVCAIKGIAHPKLSVEKAIAQLGLEADQHKNFASYSLGMKQRLALASCLLGDPEVLVLDEPTNGIDATGIVEIRQIIQSMARNGKTIILASHVLDEVEKLCSHVAILQKGRLVQTGSIVEVLQEVEGIEVSAKDPEILESLIGQCHLIGSYQRKGDLFIVKAKHEIGPSALNQYLCEKELFVEHLQVRKKTLEAHFLESLEG